MNVLEVRDVYKKLGKREIIKGISFDVKEGEIFGFLGPNGAGKTTTIRMLVGLIAQDKGSISVMGHDIKTEREKALMQVGCIVENPDMYGFLTGRQNLKQFARMYGNISEERIDEVAELVGLKDRINDKVKKYSLGMKQRLGLAQALLAKPKLLILDEPTNGLDPVGILDFRNIVKKMAKENNTAVFISSHILAEIEQACDTVAFITDGQIRAVENINELAEKSSTEHVQILTKDNDACIDILNKLSYVKKATKDKNGVNIVLERGKTSAVIQELITNNIEVEEIYKKHISLEDRFMQFVDGNPEASAKKPEDGKSKGGDNQCGV